VITKVLSVSYGAMHPNA